MTALSKGFAQMCEALSIWRTCVGYNLRMALDRFPRPVFDKQDESGGISPESENTDVLAYDPQWMTILKLAKQSQRGEFKVKEIAERYREKHPEWFRGRKTKTGQAYEH